MNSKITTTLAAAALAALTVIAPNALAQERRGGPRGDHPRQENRGGGDRNRGHNDRGYSNRSYGHDNHRYGYRGGTGYRGGYGHYVAPRYAYRHGYGRLPYRLYSGYRFFTAYPGAGYVYIAGFGWVLPPFFGAVWVPGHYDINGFWVEGFWR